MESGPLHRRRRLQIKAGGSSCSSSFPSWCPCSYSSSAASPSGTARIAIALRQQQQPPPPVPPPALQRLEPTRHFEELRLRQARAANPVARRLPAFKYDRSVKHNVVGGGEQEAACPVCLGAFQLGESVRLLPLCLHLYHAECIDLWLDAHSTCPICRSDTVPTMDVARIPPV